MPRKKRLTPNQKAYAKEVARINKFIKGAEKRGYTFENVDISPPKIIRKKDIEAIKAVRPATLYAQATFTTAEGQKLNGIEGRRYERSLASKKGQKTKAKRKAKLSKDTETLPRASFVILENIRSILDSWQPKTSWSTAFSGIKQQDKNILTNILNGAISELGETVVAARLEENSIRVYELAQSILYGASGDKKDGVQPQLAEITYLIRGNMPRASEVEGIIDYNDNYELPS